MNLQDAIQGQLPFLRAQAEGRMGSRVTVRRKTGEVVIVDGFEVPEWSATYVNVPFRLGGAERGGSGSRTVRVGDAEVQVAVRVGHFPVSTGNLRDGDLIDITSGENAGLVLRIVEAAFQDQATARRVPVVETERPAEWS